MTTERLQEIVNLKDFQKIETEIVKKTVRKKTSDFLNNALYETVENGTATTAAVPGYLVAGKTGTAQKQPRSANTYLVSFIGHVPANNPELVIFVVIDEVQNVDRQSNSTYATKLASQILEEVLPFLEIYPTEESIDTTDDVSDEEEFFPDSIPD